MRTMRTHGRRSTYTNGCRCDECKAAHRAYQRKYHRRDPARTSRENARKYRKGKTSIRRKQATYYETEEGKVVFRRKGRINRAIRRAREREAFVERVDPAVVYEMHGGMCGICK